MYTTKREWFGAVSGFKDDTVFAVSTGLAHRIRHIRRALHQRHSSG